MAGTFYTPTPVPLARPALPILVSSYDGESKLESLPNIRCLSARFDDGPASGQATFRYVFDDGGAVDIDHEWPDRPEQVFGPDAMGPYVVGQDQRIVVHAITYEGDLQVMFDGFATIPAATLSADRAVQEANFVAQGTPIRCFDSPMFGRVERDCDNATSRGYEKLSDRPICFNPIISGQSVANATQTGREANTADPLGGDGSGGDGDGTGGIAYPCFLDPLFLQDSPTPLDSQDSDGQFWTVPMAVCYILARENESEEYVKNAIFPDGTTLLDGLTSLLDAREPIDGQNYDSSDPDTYKSRPILLRNLDVTGMTWPDAINAVIYQYGFRMMFVLTQDQDNLPIWTLEIIRLDANDPSSFEQLYLQPEGSALDPGRTNVSEMHLVQDPVDVANAYEVEMAPRELEASFVLAPLFRISVGDDEDLKKYNKTETGFGAGDNENLYRLYGFDECGEGHWDFKTNAFVQTTPSLASLLGGPLQEESNYVRRRRPGRGELFTTSATGEKEKALLLISWDYSGEAPAVWDGSGTWYPVSHTWRLLKDRLGIYINVENPNAWAIGNTKVSFGELKKSSGGIVKGVSAQCQPGETRFYLMLTTVVEADRCGQARADKRSASPGRYEIRRVIQAPDRYKIQRIYSPSWYNTATTSQTSKTYQSKTVRDDTKEAIRDAVSRRAANEMPRMAGPIRCPRLTMAYQLGDRLTSVVGRGLDLRTNAGDSGGEGPTYPRITAIEYTFSPEQATILHASDNRGWKRVNHGS